MFNNILFIHGAWSSRNTFNYIASQIQTTGQIQFFEYDCQTEEPYNILKRAQRELHELNRDGKRTTIVGHSLGGILAMHLHNQASNVVTLASPLNGIDGLNFWMYTFLTMYAPIFKHITPRSQFIKDMQECDYGDTKFDVCVATRGQNIAMKKPSDGTISVDSQILWQPDDARIHTIKTSHHEIVQHPQVVSIIRQAI